MTNQHPLTDEICDKLSIVQLSQLDYDYESITFAENVKSDMRSAADWQLEQVIEWLKFEYQTDPNLSGERKRIGGFMEIAIALEQAMRPTTTQEEN